MRSDSSTGGNLGGLALDLLHPCYWPEVRRGSERFIHALGAGLAARGHRPRLLTSHAGRRRVTVEDGVEVVRNHRPRGARLQMGLRWAGLQRTYLTHLPSSYRELRRGDAAIAHALYPIDALAINRWARRTGRPAVFSAMGLPDPVALAARPGWRRALGHALRGADVAVALSNRAAERIDYVFDVPCRVINPGVDLGVFRRSAERAPAPTIFCPADLGDPRKRVDLLVAAFATIRQALPGARLLLSRPSVGAPLPRFVEAPDIQVTTLDSDDSLARAYSEAWVTALPSREEAFGLILVESLACGTPVVASVDGGGAEIIESTKLGHLAEDGDPRSLSEAVLAAADLSREEGVEEACVARARDFSADRCVEAYESLYTSLA